MTSTRDETIIIAVWCNTCTTWHTRQVREWLCCCANVTSLAARKLLLLLLLLAAAGVPPTDVRLVQLTDVRLRRFRFVGIQHANVHILYWTGVGVGRDRLGVTSLPVFITLRCVSESVYHPQRLDSCVNSEIRSQKVTLHKAY